MQHDRALRALLGCGTQGQTLPRKPLSALEPKKRAGILGPGR